MKDPEFSFEKVIMTRASTNIVEQLKSAILEGKLAPGIKLPSQRDLQKVFSVSRPVVTESLRMLEKMGLVQIKRGVKGGSFVANGTQARLGELLQMMFQLNTISVHDLMEFRAQVESTNARWCAERRTDHDLALLDERLEALGRVVETGSDWRQLLEQDALFHLAIAEVSKNRLSHIVLKVIWPNMIEAGKYHNIIPLGKRFLESLSEVLDAIRRQKGESAARIMLAHITDLNIDIMDR